ncbi:MAG: SET domain-containing protein-lysine N-methyltransferase [Beijerinckiaceae bacterium]
MTQADVPLRGGDRKPKQLARVELGGYGEYLRANAAIAKGQAIFYLDGRIDGSASKHSIQLAEDRHVVTEHSIWQFTNHACTPNMRIDTVNRNMVAVRDIAADEELTFNYNTSEWAISSPFTCGCGQEQCMGEVRGFKHVPDAGRAELKTLLTPYIEQRWAEEIARGGNGRRDVRRLRPEVHVLVPYETKDGKAVSPECDTAAFRAEIAGWFAPLGLDWAWTPVTLETIADVAEKLKQRRQEREVAVFNLCDGSEIDGYPGVSVIEALAARGLPFTGASSEFYRKSTSKIVSKRMLAASGVPTAPMAEIANPDAAIDAAIAIVGFPLIVKPDVSAQGYGNRYNSVCTTRAEVEYAYEALRADPYVKDSAIFAESFIPGREFTVFAVEDDSQPLGLRVLAPCERHWKLPADRPLLPEGTQDCLQLPVEDGLRASMEPLIRQAVRAVSGCGYARCDLRQDSRDGKLYILEVDAQCELSADPMSEIACILEYSDLSISDLVEKILNHAMTR